MEILKRNSDYALRALIHLARLGPGAVVSARAISRAEHVPEPLLRKLLQELRRAKLVVSEQGVHGGFRLARPADQITILDVVETAQGKLAVNRCFLGKNLCPNEGDCLLSATLASVQDRLVGVFEGVTLDDLVGELAPSRQGTGPGRVSGAEK
jgi:Rrf2 family protein